MSASLIIRGADFSENGIPKYDFSGDLSMTGWPNSFAPSSGAVYTFVNLRDENRNSMWTSKANGVEVLFTGGTEFKVVKYNTSNGTTTELGTFSVVAGVKKVYILDSEVTLSENEYIGVKLSGVTFRWAGQETTSGQFVQVATSTTTSNGNVPVNVVVSKNW